MIDLRLMIIISLIISTLLGIGNKDNAEQLRIIIASHHLEVANSPTQKQVELYKTILYTTDWESNSRDSLKRYLDPIVVPICEQYIEYYNIPLNELVAVVETIATSESGNSAGKPFSNTLFRNNNNPFGIKGNGTSKQTVEYYNGIRTEIIDGFMHFDNIDSAVTYLVGNMLLRERYAPVRTSSSYEEFFYTLKECGYFTHPTWHKDYFIPTCETYYLE